MIDFTDSKLVEEDGSPQICQIFTDVKANENTDNDIDPQSFTSDVPILALRNMVLFPNVAIPVAVGRDKSLALIEAAQKNENANRRNLPKRRKRRGPRSGWSISNRRSCRNYTSVGISRQFHKRHPPRQIPIPT